MQTRQLSSLFAALAHPARLTILARLNTGDASVHELLETLKLSAPAVTKHLKVLERNGLISRSRDAQFRPCRLERGKMKEANDWMAEFLAQSEQHLDRLAGYLKDVQQSDSASGRSKSKKQKGK